MLFVTRLEALADVGSWELRQHLSGNFRYSDLRRTSWIEDDDEKPKRKRSR